MGAGCDGASRIDGGPPIDILYVGTLYPPHLGGSGILGTELVCGLAALGHRLRALAPRSAPANGGAERFEARHPQIRTTWVTVPLASSGLADGSRNHDYREAEDAGIREILPRLVAERRPDVILIGRESAVGEVPPIARRHGIPTVALVQGGITIRRILADDGDRLARHQLDRLRQVDVVVAIAGHLRRDLAPLALPRVVVIPNPVDLERFTPGPKPPALLDALRLDADQVVVSHFSNFKLAKRVSDIVESAGHVLAVEPDVVYLLVGDGPDRAPIESRCRALGLTERVRSVGWVDSAEMPAYLRLTDVVVMASESEGLPLIYLEAQASGRLLVASDIPATRELVSDGETGLIFPTGDVRGLAAMTRRAVQDRTLREAIGRSALAAVRAHAKPAILDAYVRLLEGLVSSRRARTDPGLPGDNPGPAIAQPLGEDLSALVEAQGGRLVEVSSVTTLPSATLSRAAFRLGFADGRVLKGRLAATDASAARVQRWSGLLDPRHFPRLLARRGAALLSEWVDGTPGAEAPDMVALCRQAGTVQGALHRILVPVEEAARAREHWSRWAGRLERDLAQLVSAGSLDRTTAARAMAAATAAAPGEVEVGLVHGDLCLENIVIRAGIIRIVDTEDLRIYACDHDLTRTWYRWPMNDAAWSAYRDGYERERGTSRFLDSFLHWAVVTLVESAAFRLRAHTAAAGLPVARLRDLLAREAAHAHPGAAATSTGRG